MNQQRTRKENKRRSERGSILAATALSMVSMILAAGLAIDISHFYTAKAELQNAADAAALAAASQMNSTSGGIKSAVTEATKALNKYDFAKSLTITSSDVTFAKNLNGTYVDSATAIGAPSELRFVKVTLSPQAVNTTFSSMVLGNSQNLSASATAGLSVGLSMNKFYTAYAFIESAASPLVEGQTYALDAKGYNDTTPNSYRVLDGPDGSLITTGQMHAYGYIGSAYTLALLNGTSPAGNLTAPSMCRYAQIGVNTRFGDYTVHPGVNYTDQPPDAITAQGITYAEYTNRQGDGVVETIPGVPSGAYANNRRIMTLPIALNTMPDYNVGTRKVISDRLAAFFIKKKVGTDCKLEVEYIGGPRTVAVGTFTPGGDHMSDLSIPILYK
ncbi:MAG: pilus assembly protein TadG-related protein [Pyrinomonadaceae bacterium]|nr:pilus assembly protein TadG-related protein [Pyrinomonadaceae bacterium]